MPLTSLLSGNCPLRDESAQRELGSRAKVRSGAHPGLLYSTSKASPVPALLPLSRAENNSANPTDRLLSLLQRGQRSAGGTSLNKPFQILATL